MLILRRTGVRPILGLALMAFATAAHAELLTREGAVDLALQHNPEVKAARAEWDAARARAMGTWTPQDPEFEAEFEELTDVSHPGGFRARSIGVTQTIESPLKWLHTRRAAREEAKAVRLAVYELSRIDVASRVNVAFDDVLFRQQIFGFEMQQLTLVQDFGRKARLRLEAGDIPQLEVLRADVESGRAASHVAAARNDLAVALGALRTLLAMDSEQELVLSGAPATDALDLTLAQALELALEHRPDLRGAGHELASRRARRGAARAGLIPDVKVGVARQTFRDAGATENLWRLGIGVELPLWGGVRQRASLAEAGAELVRAESEAEGLRRTVLQEVETAYRNMMTASSQVALFDDSLLRQAELSQEAVVRSYAEGKASYLEVLDVQRTLLETRREYATAAFAYREALSSLDRATGGQLTFGDASK